jgi:hypothetical protein
MGDLVRVLVVRAVHHQEFPVEASVGGEEVDDDRPRVPGNARHLGVDRRERVAVPQGIGEEREDRDDERNPSVRSRSRYSREFVGSRPRPFVFTGA